MSATTIQRQQIAARHQLTKKQSLKDFQTHGQQQQQPKQDDPRIRSTESIVFQDKAREKEMRKMVAEDPNWNLPVVKELKMQCLDYIIANFAEVSFLLNILPKKYKMEVIKRLPITLPLHITFPLIDDQEYWKRCCKDRWRICDVIKHGGNWKRLYAERTMQEMIENFMPGSSEVTEIEKTLSLVKDEIVELNIRQMQPLLKYSQKNNDDVTSDIKNIEGDDDDESDDSQIEHLDLTILLPKMRSLEGLEVRYGVKNCGMNFDWNLFKFTLRDCYNLSSCLATECKWLKRLNLSNNNIDDEKIRLFVGITIDHPSLQELDLSHNKIADSGVRALAKMLLKRGPLRKLNLTDNQIRTEGAKALANALIDNRRLHTLQLRLNRLGDDGIADIFEALNSNCDLIDLDLSSCEMTESAVEALQKAVANNATLQALNISANTLNEKSGEKLLAALSDNRSLLCLDVRQTNISKNIEMKIIDKIKNNNDVLKARKK